MLGGCTCTAELALSIDSENYYLGTHIYGHLKDMIEPNNICKTGECKNKNKYFAFLMLQTNLFKN